MPTKQDIYDLLDEVHRIVTDAQDAGWSDAETQSALGSIKDYMNQIGALVHELGADPTPAPPPDPTPVSHYQGFAISYSGHDPARDVYLGTGPDQKEWGRHDGLPILAPAPGRVERYQFGTPLNAPRMVDPEYAQHHQELFGAGWVCMAPASALTLTGDPLYGSQTMQVAVFWPDTPIRLSNGQQAHAFWFGHCKPDVPVGRVDVGGRICTSWDSGVRFENNGIQARAAHVHCCGSATGTLSMNGDVDGLLVAQALGWQVEWRGAGGPGPNDYMSGQWIAGKPRSQWGGHPIPPVPS